MHGIIQANIDRFNLLLETETDRIKRAMIVRLLTEERTKELPDRPKKAIHSAYYGE